MVRATRFFRTALDRQMAAQAQREYDARRAVESGTRRLYWTARWRQIAREQLEAEPLCRRCSVDGIVTPATVCDHVEAHRGDVSKFWSGPFQALCTACHSGAKQAEEAAARPACETPAVKPLQGGGSKV